MCLSGNRWLIAINAQWLLHMSRHAGAARCFEMQLLPGPKQMVSITGRRCFMFKYVQQASARVNFSAVQTCSNHSLFIPIPIIPRPTLPSRLAHTVPSEKASALTMEWGTLVVFTCSKDLEQCRMCRWCIWRQELWALWTGDVWCLIV